MGVERHAGAALADEIAASPENLALTIGSLEQRLTRFADESAVAYATLVQLDEALTHLGTAPRAGQEWGLGALTLPVQGAWKAVTAVVSKALTDATGLPLENWVQALASGTKGFDEYLETLRAVSALAPAAGGPIAVEEAQLELIDQARTSTVGWRTAMRPVADFARALDAVLTELTHRLGDGSTTESAAVTHPAGWLSQLQRAQQRVGEAVDQAADKLHLSRAEVTTLVLGPLTRARERAATLPGELARLHTDVAALDDLLGLLDAQLRTALGRLSRGEAAIAALLFAASVRVPQLEADLTGVERERAELRGYLGVLSRMCDDGAVDLRVADTLDAEYRAQLDAATELRDALANRARLWSDEGSALLRDGVAWAEVESEVARTRQAVGQWRQAQAEARWHYVQRQRRALEQALAAVERLGALPGRG